MTNPSPFPHPNALVDQLNAAVVGGNPGAAALKSITRGCPVRPREQVLALEALLGLFPQARQDISAQAEQVRAKNMSVDPISLPSMRQALTPLMPDSPDLSWACRVLCGWVSPPLPTAEVIDQLEYAQVWELAPKALADVREHGLEGDLSRPFLHVDLKRWAAAMTDWESGHAYRAVQNLRWLLNYPGGLESMHWLASEGARREAFNV